MLRNEIKVTKTAHYYTFNADKNIDTILYVFHGYAQLASIFITEFDYLKESNVLVIAPEGLSLFYGRERTPVSSWMTSHEREDEIQDQIEYLNNLHLRIKSQFPDKKLVMLGFSQGVSALMRWLNQLNEKNVELHLCCGSIPPEIIRNELISTKINEAYYYYGSNDRLMKRNQAESALLKMKELSINHTYIPFIGIHEVPNETHKNLEKLNKGK